MKFVKACNNRGYKYTDVMHIDSLCLEWILFASSCDGGSIVPHQSQAAPRGTTRGRYMQTVLHVVPKITFTNYVVH